MIILADSGSTKTDWCLLDGAKAERVRTAGMNPYFQSEEEMAQTLQTQLLPAVMDAKAVEAVYFYGAGCASEAVNEKVARAIAHFFPVSMEVQSDLMAAARALCGRKAGIACIMGTGSNSCAYDGEHITAHVPPMGYILGDEGSGAVLGKLLVGDVVKHQLPLSVEEAFYQETGLSESAILERVYRQPFPNRFLASLVPFLKAHIAVPAVWQLVERSFEAFFVRNIATYQPEAGSAVHFVGSIAYYFQAQLSRVAEAQGLRIGRIMQSPMEGLIQYHAALE